MQVLELFVLTNLQRCGGNLGGFVAQQRDPPNSFALVGRLVGKLAIKRIEPPDHRRDRIALMIDAGKAIQQEELFPGPQQRQVLTLTMDVGKDRRQSSQDTDGRRNDRSCVGGHRGELIHPSVG